MTIQPHPTDKPVAGMRICHEGWNWCAVHTLLLICMTVAIGATPMQAAEMKWTHFVIADPLPGSSWGTGGIGLADFDGDGDLDVAISRRETQTAYWYERKDDATWVQHVIGTSETFANTLGAAALDVDHDGFVDMVYRGIWFKNPGVLPDRPDTPWQVYPYDGGGHDVIAADINGNGKLDIVSYDGHVLAWFDTTRDLAKTVVADDRDDHGGVAPKGFGDINGDGHTDLVIPGLWFENPGDGRGPWKRHPWPHKPIPNASYGTSTRVWVADTNGDGHEDIVYSDCDTGFSHVYWVKNTGGGTGWVRHQLPDPPGDPHTGSFHSLGVADFNDDDVPDVFAGEQEDPDTYMQSQGKLPMKTPGLKPRGVIWLSSGGAKPTFTPNVIHVGNPGWHDAVLGDVDGDGDVDIISKIWNKDGPTYHADYWRNDTPVRKSTPEASRD